MKEMNDMKKIIGNKEEEKHEEDKLRHEKISQRNVNGKAWKRWKIMKDKLMEKYEEDER